MSRLTTEDWSIIEDGIFLPMVSIILHQDIRIIEESPHKLKKPYINLLEMSLKKVQSDIAITKRKMRGKQLKIIQKYKDEHFTTYTFVVSGYEEVHKYFNPVIKNKVQDKLAIYLANTSDDVSV
ncbi:MAG: hypothetical protein K0S34_2303 [Bacillales bacterium]|jgi:hypothetical protein|nr:hypothetical protein [Bacillales bacterium]